MKLLKLLQLMIKESVVPTTKPTPTIKPARPGTKPEKPGKRRPLTPPKEAPKPAPKAEGIMDRITQRYKKLK
jgi:hypothetical protein